MAEHGIAAICAHTNLDAAQGGVNCRLAQRLELTDIDHLHPDGVDEQGRTYGIGRVGTPHEAGLSAEDYARFVKEKLGTTSVRFVDCGKPVTKVAVGGGSCADMMVDALAKGCDTFVTADVKYNLYLEAKQLGINLMDAGHYATENVVCAPMVEYLKEQFPDVEVVLSVCHRESYCAV
jgi:dinuclear metal center YbgI/SA1388 family protein